MGETSATYSGPGAPRSASADPASTLRAWWTDFAGQTGAVLGYEVRKLGHDPTELLLRAVQPALWLIVFGEVLSHLNVIPTGGVPYTAFIAPGILAQSVMFIAIFYGIASIRERELGIIYKFLASPAPRSALVLGKALGASARALSQAAIVYVLALAIGVALDLNPLAVLGVALVAVLGAMLFGTLSMIIASLVKTQERFLGIGQLMTMPLFFASNAIYPISLMPTWLQPVAIANPLTYMVDGLRQLMISSHPFNASLGLDFAVLIGVTTAFILLESRLYPRLVQ